jgi:hypothetical protein
MNLHEAYNKQALPYCELHNTIQTPNVQNVTLAVTLSSLLIHLE